MVSLNALILPEGFAFNFGWMDAQHLIHAKTTSKHVLRSTRLWQILFLHLSHHCVALQSKNIRYGRNLALHASNPIILYNLPESVSHGRDRGSNAVIATDDQTHFTVGQPRNLFE